MPQRYLGTFIHAPALGQLEILHDHSLLVNDDGFIVEIRPADGVASSEDISETIVLPRGTFLCPTFVDTHLHAPQFIFLGNALDKPLMQWLENTYNAELKVDSDTEFARHVYGRLTQRLIEHGTSTSLLFGTIKTETNLILAEEFQKAGLRGLVGKLSMNLSLFPNYVEDSVQDSLEAARSFIGQCNALTAHLPSHRRLVEPVVTPRFVPTCTDELLSGLGKIAEETGVRIQSHLAEAQDQVDRVRETTGREDIDVFDGHGLLTSRTVQAHCTFLTPDELRRMASRDAALAHCPLSNAYFSAKQLPLREALECGIRVGLGSDCAGGYALDMQVVMRHAVATSRIREGSRIIDRGASPVASQKDDRPVSIDWKEALFLATRGGALALGLEHCGIFRPGAAFDAQQIKLFDVDTPLGHGALDFFAPPPDRLDEASVEKWWCLGDVRNRTGMWVQGRRVSSAASG